MGKNMVSLSVSNLKKTYGVDIIFDNVSFTVNEREKVGIVGKNGAGKTTLFNIIADIEKADSGDIFIAKDSSVGYMSQNVNISSEKTVIEEVLTVFEDLINLENEIREIEHQISLYHDDVQKSEELLKLYSRKTEYFAENDGYSYNSLARGVLIGLGFSSEDLNKDVNLLSGGEKSRLLLAKILLKKPNILLLDEPTNHLDMDSINWLETFLKNYNGTVLIISHDRYFLNTLTVKTIDMSRKTAKMYNFSYENYVIEKEKDEELEMKNYELNKAEIKRQKEIIEQLKAFGREKQVKRARSREKALDKMEVIDRPVKEKLKSNIMFESSVKSGKDVMQVENISKSFDERKLFENVSMDVYRSEKIAIIGANGAGKTTFFNILLGIETADSGSVSYGTNVNREYFNQERTDLNMENSVINEVWDSYPDLKEVQVRNYLAGFLFTGDDVFKKIDDLSGGEKSRISLLKLMLSKANLLFMDEPTNHLDIASKEILEDAICAYDGTVFVISHDRYFLNKVPDRIFELKDGKFTQYLGNYDYMMEKKAELSEYNNFLKSQEDSPTKTQMKLQKKKDKEIEKEKKKLKNDEKKLLDEIHNLEEKIVHIDMELCKEEVYTDAQKMKEYSREKIEIQARIENLYEKWETLSMMLEEEN
ncbi:ABC transporter, ATP-binding protein [[Eubacterium] yurii subsp. margaretiae ATCC 43715]|nr:ABC transporter, ATP-binding protein [[Eubacterium] yurii subsp. margaretiae ATCC 43715]